MSVGDSAEARWGADPCPRLGLLFPRGPMDARTQLADLARRHGVPERRAMRLLPLMERSLGASERLRADIVEIVEATLRADLVVLRLEQEEREERALKALSRLLGPWIEEPEEN